MQLQLVSAPVHTPDQAREIIAQAMEIAQPHEGNTIKWTQVFNQACSLLGQRASTFAQPQQVPLPANLLVGNRH